MVGFFLLLILAWQHYPRIPKQLTLVDQQQQYYAANCPALIDINSSSTELVLSPTFSLLNWNIYKQQKPQWKTKLTEWVKQSDLITLQEAKYGPEFINFTQKQALNYVQNIAFEHDGYHYGVNTLSKVMPLQVCGTRYSEPWITIPKTGLATVYSIKKTTQKLLLINLHGVNFTATATPLEEQVKPYLTLVKSFEGPIIITGDFNTWNEARTKKIIDPLISVGFDETQFKSDQRLTFFGRPLDHVFYRGLNVVKAQSLAIIASDHSPQLVTFHFEE